MDILVADDEDDIREQVCGILEDEGYSPRSCATVAEAMAAIQQRLPAMAILDVWFKHCDKDGIYLLEELQRLSPNLPVLMVSGHSTVDIAVRALRIGACDFLTKPFTLDDLTRAVERGLRESRLKRDNQEMAKQLGHGLDYADFRSSAMENLLKKLEPWLKTDRRLLVTGAAGTGKSRFVQHIHQQSPRAQAGLQWHNCADFSDDAQESAVLFGSTERQVGKLELAHGGTLVLENIDCLSAVMQQSLVQFLQSKRFNRIGQGSCSVEVNVRVIATSEKTEKTLQNSDTFARSLFDCIALGVIELPPLRQRIEDLEVLLTTIQERLSLKFNHIAPMISPEALEVFRQHHWPMNIRELENVLTRLHYIGSPLSAEQAKRAIGDEEHHQQQSVALQWQGLIAGLSDELRPAREVFETHFLRYHLERFGGNVSQTAQSVGMDRASLHRKMRSLGMDSLSDSE